MRCIDLNTALLSRRARKRAAQALISTFVIAGALAGCGGVIRGGGAMGSGSASGTGGPDATARSPSGAPMPSAGSTIGTTTVTASAMPSAGAVAALPPPTGRARNWVDYQRNAARRMLAAHPDASYASKPPEPLLAIPVLDVELHADGSVRRVSVLRNPSQALDTVQLAVNAVYRAAPYGEVAHLPRPWRFSEAFLFDDNRRFKPRSLD